MHVRTVLAAIALTLTTMAPLPVLAQTGQPTVERHARGKLNNLNLSADQKAQIKRIREDSRSKIQQILTTDQKNQWMTARQQGKKMKEIMQSLNLSDTQKSQIREIQKAARTQMNGILTPEQRQQIRQSRSQNPDL